VNLAEWRTEVMTNAGWCCQGCGWRPRNPSEREKLEAHHLIFKSHCEFAYIDDPRNGIALCGPWANGCHANVHEARMKIKPEWLRPDELECLRAQGLFWIDGEPVGTLAKYFDRLETAT
jgi:hypothetical protein